MSKWHDDQKYDGNVAKSELMNRNVINGDDKARAQHSILGHGQW